MKRDIDENDTQYPDTIEETSFPIKRIRFLRYPAFLISFWVISGFFFQEKFDLPLLVIISFLVGGLIGQILFLKHPQWFLFTSFLFWFALSGFIHFLTYRIPQNYFRSQNGGVITLRGSIQFKNGKYYLCSIESFHGYPPTLLIKSQESMLKSVLYQRTEITGVYRPFIACSNPGVTNLQTFWRQKRVFGELQVKGVKILEPNSLWNRILYGINQMRNHYASQWQARLGDDYSFFAAMLWGEKDQNFQESIDLLQETGIYHTFCISGLHLSILGGTLFLLLRRVRLPRLLATIVSIVFCLLYLLFCSLSASAFRAFLMFAFYLIGKQIGRNTMSIHFISTSFLIMFFLQPEILLQPGSQLSFASTIGIIFFGEWYQKKLNQTSKVVQYLIGGTLLSTAVTVCTLPLLIFNGLTFSSLIWFSNLLLMPITQLSIFTNFIAATLGWISGIQSLLVYPVKWLLRAIIHLSSWSCDFIPHFFLKFDIRTTHFFGWYVWLGLIFLVMALLIRNQKFLILLGLGLLSVSFLLAGLWCVPRFQIWVLDVGQGLALSCLSDQNAILIDTGGIIRTYGNTGQSIILPFLKYQGVQNLDSIYLTHFHQDHTAGISPLLNTYPIQAIYARSNISLNNGWMTTMIDSPLTLYGPLLFKLEIFPVYGSNENDRALVYRIKHDDFSLLVCGDIEEQGIRELLKYGEHAIQSDVIVIPHHGAFSTSLDELLRRCRPSLAIISTGENRYGHPDRQTLALLTEKHIKYYVTDQGGAVGFYLTQKNWKVVVNGKNNFSRMDER